MSVKRFQEVDFANIIISAVKMCKMTYSDNIRFNVAKQCHSCHQVKEIANNFNYTRSGYKVITLHLFAR